ncbi:MAG: beta-glucosidase BglX [Chitinophagaceae bacterium]|nr:beta-glucosidase BglX [Chitinophagaceae bacterium]
MKVKIVFTLIQVLLGMSVLAQAEKQQTAMSTYVSALMKKMTTEEKIGQLNLPAVGFDVTGPVVSQGVDEKIRKGLVGGVFNTFTPIAVRKLQEMAVTRTRLKIPLLFGYDVIHGHRTIFPIPLGLSASWDTALIRKTAQAAAAEASADGLNWTFSPMVDIARDPRWGRVSEGAGEDPFLGAQVAKAMVRGYQGDNTYKDAHSILACVKHFALYGAAEAGRDYNTVDMSRVRMFNEYLPPYKAAIDAGVATVMSSFNEVDGVPASANRWLMTDLLRKRWGFKGFVVTDYTAINEMMAHGLGDGKEVARRAMKAPVEMDMVGELYLAHLPALVKEGKVTMTELDNACRLILEAKYKLGLFQDPYKYVSEERNEKEMMSGDKLMLAREAAIKSMVLLKNKGNILPLNAEKKIAFIGPLVKNKRDVIGSWSGAGDYKQAISVWEALEKRVTAAPIYYAKGCNLVDDTTLRNKLNPHGAMLEADSLSPEALIREAVEAAEKSDIVVVFLGEPFGMSGEAASRSEIGLLPNQKGLLVALKKTAKPIVLVLMNGRPLTLSWEDEHMDAILETWYGGTMTGPAISDVLFGDANPSGKLTMTFPRNTGQIPIYYNHKNTGRPFDAAQKYTSKYLDVSNEPLYPFGHGLGYSPFTYSGISLSSKSIQGASTITATVTVTNSGKYKGEETVQLYIKDVIGTVTRPVKELKGFQKVLLAAGESRKLSFSIGQDDLRFYNGELQLVAEPGAFKLFIGGSSEQIREASFVLQ